MELSLVGIASLLGYKISQKIAAPPRPSPSGKSVYYSNFSKELAEQEQVLANNRAEKARTPFLTNVVPSFFDLSMTNQQQRGILDGPMFNNSVSRVLSVAPAPKNFTHNNMTPYYKGYAKAGSHDSKVERFTGGIAPGVQAKQELPSLYAQRVDNTYGAPALSSVIPEDRMRQMESRTFNYQFPTAIQFPDAPDLYSRPISRPIEETRAGENQKAIVFSGQTNSGAATYGSLGPMWTATTPKRGAEDRKPKARSVPSHEMFRNVSTVAKGRLDGGNLQTANKQLDVSDIVFDHVPQSLVGGRTADPGVTTRFPRTMEVRDQGLTYNRQTIVKTDPRIRPDAFPRTKKEDGLYAATANPSYTNRNQIDSFEPEDTHRIPNYDLFNRRPLFGQMPHTEAHILPGAVDGGARIEQGGGNHFTAPTIPGGATPSMSMFTNDQTYENERFVDRTTFDTNARLRTPFPQNQFITPRRL